MNKTDDEIKAIDTQVRTMAKAIQSLTGAESVAVVWKIGDEAQLVGVGKKYTSLILNTASYLAGKLADLINEKNDSQDAKNE